MIEERLEEQELEFPRMGFFSGCIQFVPAASCTPPSHPGTPKTSNFQPFHHQYL